MLEPKPARANNSVDEVAFGVSLQTAEHGSRFVEHFINLPGELKDFMPECELINDVSVQFTSNGNPPSTSVHRLGVMLSPKESDELGRKEWMLRVESDRVVVVCTQYSSWQKVSTMAVNILNSALNELDNSDRKVTNIIFQCSDAFTSTKSRLAASNIFSKNTSLIPQNIFAKNSHLWHAHHGWIDNKLKSKFVHNLNINVGNNASSGKNNNTAVISHTATVSRTDTITISEFLNSYSGRQKLYYHQKVFNECHMQNKILMKDLLNKKILNRIGLTD
ncbi:MAG: hypothetical protein K0U66_06090 [Gammaproteobacteria bacterium]|nr:hypothetical protein [Gammaproteobacteria bacterium]